MGDLSIKVRELMGTFIWIMIALGVNEMVLTLKDVLMRLTYKELSDQSYF